MDAISTIEDQLYNLQFTDELSILTNLSKLQHHLSQASTTERIALENRLIRSNVPRLICATLKQDFSKLPDSWNQALTMCQLLATMMQAFGRDGESETSDPPEELTSEAVECILILLRRLQKRLLQTKRDSDEQFEMIHQEIFHVIEQVLNTVYQIMRGTPRVALLIPTSPWFLQLFIVDDPKLTALFISLLIVCIQTRPEILQRMEYTQKISIIDELVYHFAVLDSLNTVDHTLNCLLVILGCDVKLRSTILKRYRGIQLLVARWITQLCLAEKGSCVAVDSPTKKMLLSLEHLLGEFHSSADNIAAIDCVAKFPVLDEQQAATVIQSYWRGYTVRKSLFTINRALSKFQRHYRQRYRQRDSSQCQERIEAEFQHFVRLTRRRRWREKLEAELDLLSSLPAPLIDREEHRKQTEAAVRIQAAYRGYRVRAGLSDQRAMAIRHKAARAIQTWYRSHLSRRECLQVIRPVGYGKSESLQKENQTKESLVKTKERHRGWCETHPSVPMSRDQLDELHKTIQLRLRSFQLDRLKMQQQNEIRRVNLARITVDADLLLSEPTEQVSVDPRKEPTESGLARAVASHCGSDNRLSLEPFRCRTQPLAKLAQDEHRKCLTGMGKPWWARVMRRWQEDTTRWLEANECADGANGTSDRSSVDKYLAWLPDDIFDDNESLGAATTDYERTFSVLGDDEYYTNEPV